MNEDAMSQLVEFIIQMPPENSNEKRAFRYPFYASELLSCEISKVEEAFFNK